MGLINVTVSKGNLFSEMYKNAVITSESLELMGTSMVMQGGKVTSLSGEVTKKSPKETIGSFSYQNGGDGEMYANRTHATMGYNCNISINKEEDAALQVEATNALLSGIAELQKVEVV